MNEKLEKLNRQKTAGSRQDLCANLFAGSG